MSRWLVALDIDGTIVHDDGFLSPKVYEQVQRVKSLGHEVVIATGRSAANSYPIARELDFPGENAVASNGAVSYRYDNQGFEVVEVESFDPAPVLNRLIEVIPDAHFAVEDLDGSYRFHKPFPVYALGEENFETPLEQLLHHPVSRVVVLSPSHDVEQFLTLMRQVGLHSVSYSIGYTAWLDIAPDGVHKGHGLEKLRQKLEIDPKRVICIGDGRNDIEMFQWAKNAGGHSFAMGQAPDEVKLAATAVTASVEQDGVAEVLSGFEGLEFIHAN
ncbi:MAG: HAD family hydrolase [Microbacteriaceae bacterium]|nr:HAD family hydrolase [Microbacteriaceae bacterium]